MGGLGGRGSGQANKGIDPNRRGRTGLSPKNLEIEKNYERIFLKMEHSSHFNINKCQNTSSNTKFLTDYVSILPKMEMFLKIKTLMRYA